MLLLLQKSKATGGDPMLWKMLSAQNGAEAAAAVTEDAEDQRKRPAPEAAKFKLILVGDAAVGRQEFKP
jgi:hypothetical protein